MPNPSTNPPPSGDPSSIARRVESIVEIIQVRGHFDRAPNRPGETLEPMFPDCVAKGQLLPSNRLLVEIGFGFYLRSEAPASQVPPGSPQPGSHPDAQLIRFAAEAAWVIVYQLASGQDPADGDLQAFASVNGRLNATPYWRHFLQSSLLASGLSPILAPPYRVEPPKAQ